MVTTDPTPPDRISPIRIEDEMRELENDQRIRRNQMEDEMRRNQD